MFAGSKDPAPRTAFDGAAPRPGMGAASQNTLQHGKGRHRRAYTDPHPVCFDGEVLKQVGMEQESKRK